MKLGLIADNAHKAICEHTKNVVVGIDDMTEAVIVEHPLTHVPDIDSINTCVAVRNLLTNTQMEEAFLAELNIKPGPSASLLYGYIGPKGFSDLLEVSYSTKFMSGDVGQNLGFVQGTGIPASPDIRMAFPQINKIEKALIDIEYKGEIVLGCAADYTICDIKYGHQTGLFALFTELSVLPPQANFEWCLGKGEKCSLHSDGVSVCTLLSNSPFPVPSPQPTTLIAPVGAERHLYRLVFNSHEVAFVSTWGTSIMEAKRRTRRTIENCVSFNPFLQYRIDYGYKERFIFNADRYKELGGQ
jgi:hypothetical protein